VTDHSPIVAPAQESGDDGEMDEVGEPDEGGRGLKVRPVAVGISRTGHREVN
jgi:hypothetical protein